MESHWQTINNFQKLLSEKGNDDLFELESAFMALLQHLNINDLQKSAGYSQTFPRYITDATLVPTPQKLEELKRHYWVRQKQLSDLERQIKQRTDSIQEKCEHEWEKDYESRDNRSRYDCKICGAYR